MGQPAAVNPDPRLTVYAVARRWPIVHFDVSPGVFKVPVLGIELQRFALEALRSIKDFEAPLMLPDTSVDTTEDGQPAVSKVVVQKYNGRGYDTVQTFE